MGYSHTTRAWGDIPKIQTLTNVAIPASTTTLAIEFDCEEIALEFLDNAPDSKLCLAADATAAAAAFAGDDYHLRRAGDCVSYYKPADGGSLYVLNSTAVAASGALNVTKIRF